MDLANSDWRGLPLDRQAKWIYPKNRRDKAYHPPRNTQRDYKSFRISRINCPEFSHLKLLFGWLVYFAMFYLTETLIPAEQCIPVHMWLDDVISFQEWFVIPYILWYGLLAFSLGYFAVYNVDSFRRLQIYIIITQVLAIVIYIVFPTRQDLRPEVFPRDNFLTDMVQFLYRIDTNTGVCPSMHVTFSLAMASVWGKEGGVGKLWKGCIYVAVTLICLSTMFIKQHSAVDFFAAIPICLLAEWITYGKDCRSKKNSTK